MMNLRMYGTVILFTLFASLGGLHSAKTLAANQNLGTELPDHKVFLVSGGSKVIFNVTNSKGPKSLQEACVDARKKVQEDLIQKCKSFSGRSLEFADGVIRDGRNGDYGYCEIYLKVKCEVGF